MTEDEDIAVEEEPRNECRVCLTDDVLQAPIPAGDVQLIYCRNCKAVCIVDSRENRTWYALQGYVWRA